jgi:predicted nucleic acid-binding Zn ribbon protein
MARRASQAPPADEDERIFRLDAKRKQIHLPPLKKVSEALSTVLARSGCARVLSNQALVTHWQQCVGNRLAQHTRIASVKRGVLEVIVRNSIVLQELTFERQNILRKWSTSATQPAITDLRFRVGSID